MIYANVF